MKLRRVEVTDWKTGSKKEALFHGFGSEVIESCDGNTSYSIAIVENQDGTVDTVVPQYIRFLDPPEQQP